MPFESTDPFTTEGGFFETDSQPSEGLLPLQTIPEGPEVEGLDRGTGLLNPPLITQDAVRNFPPDLYDLRSESHLMRFMRALIGDSGAGQLAKRNTIVRLASTLAGSHFYDLDGLYGAIFGEGRQQQEQLPFNPQAGLATVDEWEAIRAIDAGYRNRIEALARAIPLGGTVPGMQMAAEAVVGAPCEVYEIWRFLGSDGFTPAINNTWTETTSDPDNPPDGDDGSVIWDEVSGESWSSLEGSVVLGRSETNTAAEFIVRPIKDYSKDFDGRIREADRRSLTQVLGKLKPAGSLLTIDDRGVAIHVDAVMRGVSSDSDFWEIGKRVLRRNVGRIPARVLYPESGAADLGISFPINGMELESVPPMSGAVGYRVSHAGNIVGANGYILSGLEDEAPDSIEGGVLSEPTNWEDMILGDGTREAFLPQRGIIDPGAASAALMSEDNSLVAHPYSSSATSPQYVEWVYG
jgi:hypothetical protein